MAVARRFRIGALVVLVLALQAAQYRSLAQPQQGGGSQQSANGGDSGSSSNGNKNGGSGTGNGASSGGTGGGPGNKGGGKLSPEEMKALADAALQDERNEVNDFKNKYKQRRHWRGFCLCAGNMFDATPDDSFVNSCFTDLTSSCYHKGFAVPLEEQTGGIFSYELCSLLTEVDAGSVTQEFLSQMDYEVKRKCKHPYRADTLELLNFFRDSVMVEPGLLQKMTDAGFMGQMFSDLTESQAEYMGFPISFYNDLLKARDYLIFSGKTVPYTVDRGSNLTVQSTVEANIQIDDVYDINEKDFTFQAAFTLSFAWTDQNMWSDCLAEDEDIDQGECRWVWRPEPVFKNARELEISKKSLVFLGGYKSAFYTIHARGLFSTPMSFKKFPRDWQDLLIEFSLKPSAASTTDTLYDNFKFFPVTALSTMAMTSESGHDAISGWRLHGVSATEKMSMRTYESTNLLKAAGSSVWKRVEKQIERLFGDSYMPGVEYESTVTATIVVERVTSYYMLNFTLVVALLTIMSWVSFFLPPQDLNDRATLSLTIILALNVFQLIMNDNLPETGYLTPLSIFIIGSTFFASFATVESVVVFVLQRRTAMREEVVRKFRGSISVSPLPAQQEGSEKVEASSKVSLLRRAMTLENIEKLLANHLDYFCIIFLPVSYTIMTLVVFDLF
ncbi:ligand-gated ion-channel protein [Chloropicon primus]|uniref:Ligand-gated ion-channel protein n=1 Tax=Chloropicon primus TaxID=1764295 RepID=A0A5B8MEV2_9CHLO|nr:ligand-gated ion-channel protein [Chloropicon primus]UPQ97426.1 ligand-gated ion-channel protein [Chloropicon primus]|eukprot:QDZ18215.1 ligand-gated ion-channel protein [Chloropicon primus]